MENVNQMDENKAQTSGKFPVPELVFRPTSVGGWVGNEEYFSALFGMTFPSDLFKAEPWGAQIHAIVVPPPQTWGNIVIPNVGGNRGAGHGVVIATGPQSGYPANLSLGDGPSSGQLIGQRIFFQHYAGFDLLLADDPAKHKATRELYTASSSDSSGALHSDFDNPYKCIPDAQVLASLGPCQYEDIPRAEPIEDGHPSDIEDG